MYFLIKRAENTIVRIKNLFYFILTKREGGAYIWQASQIRLKRTNQGLQIALAVIQVQKTALDSLESRFSF